MSPRLILCDFDGTVTLRDTNSFLANALASEAAVGTADALASRSMTLREVLDREVSAMTAEHDQVLELALTIPFRAGLRELVDGAADRGDRFVVLSSGFRQLIEPMLAHAGFPDLELVCNDVEHGAGGGRITWRELPVCDICSEECKRHDVRRLGERESFGEVVFIGDGFSDRCGAEAADRIFAVAGGALQRDLVRKGREFTAFDTLTEVANSLAASGPGAPDQSA